ncbi:zonadhesin isoform 2-T2 [Lycaon pictus]
MAPPVWTLVLLVGAAWGQGHMPTPVRKEKPPDWKPGDRSSTDNSILTQCDFEDDAKPLCDWTQESTDDGDWIRTSGPSPTGSTGPPGGYPNGEGHYLHMDSNTFHRGGVARLQSPPLWVQGPLCVYFAYHMFGLSWGAQLKLLLLRDTKKKHPSLLWKHINTQRPSWMPTAVTVPMGLVLPSRLTFEGMRGSTAYLDISLDAISIHRGSCNRVCMMQTCSFDIPNDLCGWSWIPTASGAKWVQKKGPSKVPNVGPEDDFSSPGSGFYMLLDPKNAKPRQKSVLLSPLRHSSGCMSLSLHYILRGQSPGAALIIYAAILGSIRKHTLFSGQPGPNWQPASVNYTGQGQIQFTVVGVFGETPEPAVAVDAISIAPCGEGFPQCDFEDDAHPFCDWAQVSGDGGHWTRGNKNIHIQGAGSFGGPYIYVEANKFSVAGQSFRLVSRPFCAPGAICVEFAYHMYGLGEGTKLSLLLESPAGSAPSTLWHRTGSQSPNWLNASVTIPLGHQQPMQLILEAIRGTNTAFVVAVGFILINHGTCRGTVPTVFPSKSPVSTLGPSEIPVSTGKPVTTTEKPMAPTEKHTVPSEIAIVPTEKPKASTEKPMVPTEKPMAPTEKHTVPSEIAIVPTEKPMVLTEKTMIPTEKPMAPSGKTMVPTEKHTIPREITTVPTEKSIALTEKHTVPSEIASVPTEKPMAPTEKHTFPSEIAAVPTKQPMTPTKKHAVPSEIAAAPTKKPMAPTEKHTVPSEVAAVPTEKTMAPTEKHTFPSEIATVPTKKPMVPSEMFTVSSERPTFPSGKSTALTEKLTISTEKPTMPTGKPIIPTEKPSVPTEETIIPSEETTVPPEESTMPPEKSTVPTEESVVPIEESTIPFEEPTISTEESTVSTEESTGRPEKPNIPTEESAVPFGESSISTEKPTVHTKRTIISTEKPTIPTEKPTVRPEKPMVLTERSTVTTERPIVPTEKPTIPTEKTTIPTAKPTIPAERFTIPTEKLTVPTTKPTISTESSTVPTENPTIPAEKPTIPTEKTMVSTERPTIPTEKPTILTEKTTILTEKLTVPTEKTTTPTENPTIPTEKTTIPTENLTILTEKPSISTAKPTIPAERFTIPTDKLTVPTTKPTISTESSTVPTENPTIPAEKPTITTEKIMVSMERPTIPTEKPIIPTEKTTMPTEKPIVPTEKPIIPTEKSTVPTEKPTIPTEKHTVPTEKLTIPTEKLTVPIEKPTVPTEKTMVLMEKTTVPTEKPTIPTEKTTIPTEKSIPTEKPTVPTEKPIILTEQPTIPTEKPTIPTERTTILTERPTILTEKTTIPTERPIIPTEKTSIPTERPPIPTEKTSIPTEKLTITTEKTTVPTERPTIPTEKTTIATERPIIPTEKTSIPTERLTILTEKTSVPTERPTIPTEKTSIPTKRPTIPTEKTSIPTKRLTITTEKTTVPTERPTIPTEKTSILTERPTIPTEKTSVPTERPTIPTEKTSIPTKRPTIPTEKTSIPTRRLTITTEKTTVPTERPTIPTEKTSIPTKRLTITTEKTTVPTERPTIPTEKTSSPTKRPTIPTEKTSIPTKRLTITTEKTTVPTERPTIPTEKTSIPTERPTIPTEKTTIPTERPTIPTEKTTIPTERPTIPLEKTTMPTEKSTVPTERHTAPTTPQLSPTLVPVGPTVLVMPSTTAPSTSMTTTTPRPTPAKCPPNAHYDPCACPASCERPKPSCGPLCKPGCVCNFGFLFRESNCIRASSCNCFYNNKSYKPGAEWFSSNCTERCHCRPGSQIECHLARCGTNTVCQLNNGQYECQPYGTGTCAVYGDPHQVTFDGRHFSFLGKCTYILAQTCGNSTEPFFRVAAKNEDRGQKGMSYLSKIYVTLPGVTITLLKGRETLVGGRQVTLPAIPSKGIFLASSGRFVELQTFGLRVRWDGDQQLFMNVHSTYSRKLCGFCGNYDGDSGNDNWKPDGTPALNAEELGNSWRMAEDEDKECPKNTTNPSSCNSGFLNSLSGLLYCGRLTDTHGAFEACLPHLKTSRFFKNCILDGCKSEGLQSGLCLHMAVLTEICQEAGYPVKPWREPQFCPLTCPPNSRYTVCARPCPATCHSGFFGMSCQERCVEGCECNPGFVLNGLQCVLPSQCGCLEPTMGYLKVGEQWFKPGCRELCACEGKNRIHCRHWKCQSQEVCAQYNGTYGCHARESATCAVSGDPHYLTFDGALHHFMGTCAYILTQPCQPTPLENFTVSTTSEFRSGNLEASYVRAVNVQVFNLKISLIKGYKVMLNGRRVALPLWPAQGRVSIRPSGSFILLYTDFGLQVRYDGNHLVEVTVPSSYAGQLCGLCGNYNNNSLDDNLLPNKRPVSGSAYLGAAWKLPEYSEPGCFVRGAKPFRCHSASEANRWRKGCDILRSYRGPFSQCHSMVSPQSSFVSCVYGQCVTKGDPLTLCRSLQAYASLCAHAGQALSWRNSTFCPLKCPSGSNYSHCANPCPATCLSLNTPRDCSAVLPCTEGCECQKGHILSGTSCVPLSQCGCVDQEGYYHLVGESWYTDNFCSRLCTCSTHNIISCHQTTCKTGQLCRPVDGLLRCRASGMGVCRTSNYSQYVTFDGSHHTFRGTCTYVLVKVCHSTMDLPFFKISGKHRKQKGQSDASYLYQVNVDIFNTQVTLKSDTRVLINGTQVTLPSTTQIQGVRITTSGIYTLLNVNIGLQVKFDGNGFLEVELPTVYYQKVCGMCGNFNGEEEDELMMPDDELAQNDSEFVDSWQDKESNPNCQQEDQKIQAERQKLDINCSTADIARAQEQCQVAFEAPAWAQCATHVVPRRFLLLCIQKLCRFGRLKSALCGSLETFGAACKAKGLKTPIWRNSSFCPLKCPTHSSYSTCLPTCSASCMDQCNGSQVPSVCKEGCICQPGYVLSGQQCVPRSQCGCTDDYGSTFPEGKTWIAVHCTRSCSCTEGSVHCQQFSCPAGSHCEPKPGGVGSCELNRSGQCSIYGDPHYHTFDGLRYLFRGRMTYTLIKTIDGLPAEVVPLVVEGRNKVYSSWSPVFLHEIIVIVYGFTVQLQADLQLVVNNQKMAIPFTPNSHLHVTMRGHRLYLITDFKMIVTFHGGKNAVITLPSMYKKLVLGLCGNFDGNKRNDFMLPNGTVTDNLVSFSHSWEVQKITGGDLARFSRAIQEKEEKEEEELGFHASECSMEQLRLINSTQACRVLVDPYGPFAACHQTVAPGPFQEHCMFDLCAARNPKEQEELRCQVLSGYAIICQEAGATLASWRDHTHCALACPANTVYQSCMTPCPASCANLAAPRDCEGPCVEGCASLPGYVYSGAWSLPLAHCGCTNNGVYYQRGDSFVTEDCSQRCTCASSGVLLCEPLSCRAGEICTLGNLTRGCFRESPCLQNPCQNDGQCQEQGTHFTCECELGYGGHLCTESRNVPPPRKPEASNFAAILLGMLVPVLVLVPAVTRACVSRKKRRRKREKTQS